jgi:ferritin-like metal-binding protein YciE
MEKMKDLKGLLRHEIEDLYSVEEQIIAALPLMIEKADNPTLKTALEEHLEVTKEQKKRLDQIQKQLGPQERGKKGFLSGLLSGKHECKGMKGIIEEGNKIMAEDLSPEVMDAAIVAAAQKVEHYEICGYGTARSYARELGLTKIQQLLQQTLDEEYEADDLLTVLAESSINEEAEDARASGRRSSAEKVRKEEMEMEPVSSKRNSSTGARSGSESSRSRRGGSSPKKSASASRGNSANGRSSSAGNNRSSSGSRGNSSNGRGSSARGNSSRGGR